MDCDTQSDPSVTAPPRYLVKAGRQRLGISTEFSMGPELEVFDVRSMMEKCGGGVPLEACNQHIPWRLELWQKCTNKLMTFTLWGFGRQQACKVCVMAVGAGQDTKDVCVARFVVQTMAAV